MNVEGYSSDDTLSSDDEMYQPSLESNDSLEYSSSEEDTMMDIPQEIEEPSKKRQKTS